MNEVYYFLSKTSIVPPQNGLKVQIGLLLATFLFSWSALLLLNGLLLGGVFISVVL